ncbi:LysR family transcriptional regulator [Pararhizobium polonicum]|uniref:HTH-type transcriptional regulator TtuA n=1 Tax=Pararhizobium polonicum TaxID=1612624 RepID=A0A1C7NSS1_9HYPH|nr:LysR family transcriptional regulator [Pararhizobium polonicum]OBZ92058.1 LysR family transcriptional regulator [Pararhizobium polonicum]
MARDNIRDIAAFLIVARERSFTRAAAKIGVSQSALSQTLRGLEERLGIRLLTRNTRGVSPTEAGELLLQSVGPHFDGINAGIAALSGLKEKPSGTVRITADQHAAEDVLWPALDNFLPKFPDIKVEIVIDYGLTDIVAEQYDAGVRIGEVIAKDMIAVPIGPDMRMIVVGAPRYLETHGIPQTPQELTGHNCINLRLPTYGGLYAWEFEHHGRELNVRVEGQLMFNSLGMIITAALAGHGLAYVPENRVRGQLEENRLALLLDDYCQPFSGYHLYYPSRRQPTPAFTAVVNALRYREPCSRS